MPEPREVSRRLVAGSWAAVTLDNLRATYLSADQALDYVADVGFSPSADRQLFAVVETVYQEARPTRRRSLDDLSEATRARYLASRQARSEARAHSMSVEDWYEVAPDIKAFRGHAKGRRPQAPIFPRAANYTVYIAREYKNVSRQKRSAMSRRVKQAWQRRKAA